MEKIEIQQATMFDIRICLIKKGFDPSEYGNSLVIGSDFQSAYELRSGESLPDHAYDSASFKIIGFDEPFDGYAFNFNVSTIDDEMLAGYGVFTENGKEFFSELKSQIQNHLHVHKAVASAFEKIISAAWGFDCDPDEIEDEALRKIKGVDHVEAFGGSDAVDTDDVNFAGGIFVEVTPYHMLPASMSEEGIINISDDIEIEEYRRDGDRFVFALKNK